jgi:hypothetical protein
VSSAAQELVQTPPWCTPIELLLVRAAREVRILAALTPCHVQRERERLVGELRAGRRATPRWTYTPRPHEDLRRALEAAEAMLEQRGRTPLDALYLDRVRELSLEAAMCASAGTSALAPLARARFEPRGPGTARAAAELCAAWLAEACPPLGEATMASDDPHPGSLLSRMSAAVGQLRLPFAVVATPHLAPLAATGERAILVATARMVHEEDAIRTVLHEVEGHARPRAQALRASTPHFRIGTARGIDDQEGRAVLLEERAGLLGPRRKRQLASRHRAVESMLAGASFEDVAEDLVTRFELDAGEAVIVAERAFRGGNGVHPGLGRERVYLESLVRVKAHLKKRPQDDAVLAAGQVSVEATEALRDLVPTP